MIRRILKLSKSNSFFLFGARGTGKSTLIKQYFSQHFSPLEYQVINLLDLDEEFKYRTNPQLLVATYKASASRPKWIIIDEVQKIPQLLDAVHQLIEEYKVKFVLTGSSARKLKHSQANLLAGRAFHFSLFPFSFLELEKNFDLDSALNFGTLPKIFDIDLQDDEDKNRFLKSYVHTYLKEEIIVEQLIRNIEPFHRFLEVAAQTNGEIINYTKLGREASVTDKSVARYFEILQDTLVGILLPAYSKSVRKQQVESPKFYFFDTGIVRALKNNLRNKCMPQTYEYGKQFESFIINEIYKLNQYYETDYKMSYLKTKDGQEIDLIIETGKLIYLIEIKSGQINEAQKVRHLNHFVKDFKKSQALVLCQNEQAIMLDENILALPWKEGILKIFNL